VIPAGIKWPAEVPHQLQDALTVPVDEVTSSLVLAPLKSLPVTVAL
jgi:hypothetical protein